MATRLNKTMIDEIIEDVINDTTIPAEIEAFKKEVYDRGTQLTRALVPEGLLKLSKQYPREWFHWVNCIYTRYKEYDQNPLGTVGEPNHHNIAIEPTPWPDNSSGSNVPMSEFADLFEKGTEIMARKTRTEQELRAFLLSRRTVEAVVKDMPELEKHMTVKPQVIGGALVAASNVLSTLTASGFSVSAQSQKV